MTRAADEQVSAWAARHDLGGNLSEWRVIFEDAQTLNQCDGCMQRAEIRNGLHYDQDGKAFMACQRARYASEAAPAAQPAVTAKWPPTTAAELIACLQGFPGDTRVSGAYFVQLEDKHREARLRLLTVSRERADGNRIREGDQSVPYSLVFWTSQDERAQPATPLREVLSDEQIEELAHRNAHRYLHGSTNPSDNSLAHYVFDRATLLDFARALRGEKT